MSHIKPSKYCDINDHLVLFRINALNIFLYKFICHLFHHSQESGSAQQLKEDVTCFLDNAKRTISHEQQFNPLTGHSTYAEAPKGVHIHHVDEQDLVGK